MPAQSNAVTSALLFVSALVADALTATENVKQADAPASLRGAGLVLVACFAAPVVTRPEIGVYGRAQRPLLGLLLLAASLAGAHQGGVLTRAFDSAFITIAGLAMVWLYSAGGIDEQAKKVEGKGIEAAVATSSAMMAGSLMLYANVRILRAGIRHSTEVSAFHIEVPSAVNATGFSTLGYAYASDVATAAVCFGAAVGIGAAAVMVAHVHELQRGTGAIALQLGVAGVFQALCALIAGLTFGDQVDWLPAVYSSSSCKSAAPVCAAAAASRRFAMTNTQTPGLWLSCLGLLALAFPPSVRVSSRAEAAQFAWSTAGVLFGLAAMGIAMAFVWLYSSFTGASWQSDYVMLISLAGLFWSAFVEGISGSLIYVGAWAWEFWQCTQLFSALAVFSHLTNVVLALNVALLALHALLSLLLLAFAFRWIETLTGLVAALGASLSTGLFLGSAHLVACANGSFDELRGEGLGARFSVTFTWQHFLPVFVWMPLFACRCEVSRLSTSQRVVAWITALPLCALVYGWVLVSAGLPAPAAALVEPWSVGAALLGGLLAPWLAASSV